MAVILLNSLILALDGEGTSDLMHATLELANDGCTLIFVAEVVLKLIAFGLIDFLTEGWNVFDLIVVGYSRRSYNTFVTPDVSLHLLHKTPCSIMFVPWNPASR